MAKRRKRRRVSYEHDFGGTSAAVLSVAAVFIIVPTVLYVRHRFRAHGSVDVPLAIVVSEGGLFVAAVVAVLSWLWSRKKGRPTRKRRVG
jgi:hypothetical protein